MIKSIYGENTEKFQQKPRIASNTVLKIASVE